MPKFSAAEVEPVNNYYAGGSRRARQLAASVPSLKGRAQDAQAPTSPPATGKGSLRQFLAERQPASATVVALRPVKPTKQRLAKDDKPAETRAGFYRAPAPIERMRDRKQLDMQSPAINAAMYEAAQKLGQHFYEAGLNGLQAQNLASCVHGSGDGAACSFPKTERAMHHRQKFREACTIMGWFEAHPYKGAGRLVVDVICYEMTSPTRPRSTSRPVAPTRPGSAPPSTACGPGCSSWRRTGG